MTSSVTTGSAKRCSAIRSGRGRRGCKRLFFRAQHHIQPGDEAFAQPRRQFAARPRVRHLADGLEAGASQGAQ